MATKKNISFEQALSRLEEIAAGLEDGSMTLEASLKAMKIALEQLSVKAEAVLVDGPYGLHQEVIPQRPIVKGDALSASVAAASILAKTERDRIMVAYDALYPEYGFKKHKGYPTKQHRESIHQHGLSPIHRRTFRVK